MDGDPTPARNASCPVHAFTHRSTPDPTLGQLAAVTRFSSFFASRGGPVLVFRVVSSIVDVLPPRTGEERRESAKNREREGEREIVGGNGWTRRGVGVPRKRKKESTVGGVGRERGDEHTSCFPRAARCKRRASRAHLYVQPSLSKGNGISQGVGYNGEEEKRAIATGVVDPWMIAGTTA